MFILKLAEKQYYAEQLNMKGNYIKETWSILNKSINNNTVEHIDGVKITEQICKEFKNVFTQIEIN